MYHERSLGLKVGPEIQVADKTILEPGTNLVNVKINGRLPNTPLVSVRSRYAQLGIDAPKGHLRDLAPKKDDELPVGQHTLPILNHSHFPILLPPESRLLRTYEVSTSPLRGRYLLERLKRGGIKIEGEQDYDWFLNRDLSGIFLRIREGRKTPARGSRPFISISDNSVNPREAVDHLLVKQESSERLTFWVGETPHITFVGVDALISQTLYRQGKPLQLNQAFHLNSPLVDSGSKWPLRVEIVSPTTEDLIPHFIFLRFWRNQK